MSRLPDKHTPVAEAIPPVCFLRGRSEKANLNVNRREAARGGGLAGEPARQWHRLLPGNPPRAAGQGRGAAGA